jgi:conjugative relaxase-like TrwC/TraI family protein
MMSLAHMATYAYYVREKLVDYYRRAGSTVMEWFGRGAAARGLVGPVQRQDFLNLADGVDQDGSKLVRNAKVKGRIPGVDAVFSADKTVSVTWALETDTYRRAIDRVLIAAARTALQFLEDNALFTRLGKGGAIIERAAGMFACTSLDYLSRANQVDLHVHCPLFWVVLRQDGKTGAPLGITARDPKEDRLRTRSPLYALKKQAGAVFQESVAKGMAELGYRMEKTKHGYAVAGVPPELCEKWSSRRKDIVRYMDERGTSGARAAAKAAERTRLPKRAVRLEDLERTWKEDARVSTLQPFAPRPRSRRGEKSSRSMSRRRPSTPDGRTTIASRILKRRSLARTSAAAPARTMTTLPKRIALSPRLRRSPGSTAAQGAITPTL